MNLVLATKLKNLKSSIVDGTGVRLVVFTSGCPHHCKDCHNPETWNIKNGFTYEVKEVFNEISKKLDTGKYDGITLSGGDPLYQKDAILELVILLKEEYPDINIWSYTGYVYEDIQQDKVITQILSKINVLIDGPFISEKKSLLKKYRGSENQRILYLDNGVIKKIK